MAHCELTPQIKKIKQKMLSSLMFEHGAHAVTAGPERVNFPAHIRVQTRMIQNTYNKTN